MLREWSPNVHVEDEEIKRAYRAVVEAEDLKKNDQYSSTKVIND